MLAQEGISVCFSHTLVVCQCKSGLTKYGAWANGVSPSSPAKKCEQPLNWKPQTKEAMLPRLLTRSCCTGLTNNDNTCISSPTVVRRRTWGQFRFGRSFVPKNSKESSSCKCCCGCRHPVLVS